MSLILMSETSAIIILQRKVNRLKASTGNAKLRSKLDTGLTPRQLFKYSIVRPAKMLFLSTICFAISLYIAITYSYLYILFTTFSAVFKDQYGWDGGITGLSFLGLGVGSLIGQLLYIRYGNKIVNKHIARGDFCPEHRLYTMCVGGVFIPAGLCKSSAHLVTRIMLTRKLVIYGWSVQYQTHFMVPMFATGLIGFGLLMTFMPSATYLVDVFTIHAASAMAASTVLRSLAAAFIPLSSRTMYAQMGYGWGNTMLGLIATLLIPIPFLFIRYGDRIRARSTVKL